MTRYGITIRPHGDFPDEQWVFVDCGTDPVDGMPLQKAAPAPAELVALWQRGRYEDVARALQAMGLPVMVPAKAKWWRRAWRWLSTSLTATR